MNVLHVDDDYADHVLVAHWLGQAPGPCDVRWAPDLHEAARHILERRVDIVLLDLQLTRVHGLQTLHAFHQLRARAPIIVLTGHDDQATAVAAITAGAEDFLCKDRLDPFGLWNALTLSLTRWRTRSTPPPSRDTVVADPRQLFAGQTCDSYVVEREISKGGTSIVYQVRHLTLGTPHAMKVLRPGGQVSPRRIRLESWVQARLRHPNLVRAIDLVDLGDDNVGLVMDYVDGPTLAQWVAGRTLPGPAWLRVFRDVVQGVAYAHAHGLVHRDLKPANVLLEGGGTPRVTDFGVAMVLGNDDTSSSWGDRTMEGVMLGTPGYIAPEQIDDASAVDHRADLFSLGCILYLMLCSRPAYAGPTPIATLIANAQGQHIDPGALVPPLPDPLVQITRALLQVDPRKRMRSCRELLTALDAIDVRDVPPCTVTLTPHQIASDTR